MDCHGWMNHGIILDEYGTFLYHLTSNMVFREGVWEWVIFPILLRAKGARTYANTNVIKHT